MNRARTTFTVALTLLLATACSKKPEQAPAGKRSLKQLAFPVEVVTVDARPRELSITAPGVVDAFERIQVTARVSGVVDKVTFVEGQEIKRGVALADIDSRRYALAVSSARAALNKAQATALDSSESLKRRENASATNPGLIPGEEIETYKTRVRTAEADVSQANEAVKLAQLNLDDSQVKAPAAGIIQTRSVQTGQYVQAGTVIATLLQRDPMLLHFNVTTAEAPRLKVGMPVDFTLKESQQSYTAKITLVAGAADPESRLVPVTAEIDATRQFWLRPGSFASVAVKLTSQRQFPMIPQAAARPSERGFLAFVVEGDQAHERVLQLGMNTSDGWVEVRDGLKAGDLLVTRGVEALAEGTKVKVSPASPASSASSANAPSTAPLPAGSAQAEGKHKRSPASAGSTTPAVTEVQ